MKKSANIQYIEECIDSLDFNNIKNPNNKKYLQTIQRFLDREYGNISQCKDIKIMPNKTSEIFGMLVAPDTDDINKMVNTLTGNNNVSKSELSVQPTGYYIEIDSKIKSPMVNLTSGEITAILLHEIGHIILNSKFIEDMNLMYAEAKHKVFSKEETKTSKQSEYISSMLFIYNYMTKHQLTNEIKNLSVEKDADKYAVKAGYGQELESALQKFAYYYNVTPHYISQNTSKSAHDDFKDAKLYAEYSKYFDARKNYVRELLDSELKEASPISYYWYRFLTDAKTSYFKILNKLKINHEVIHESLISRLLGITPSVSRKDIDEIEIEVQMVENYEDKMYLIRKINNKLDDVDQALSLAKQINNKQKLSILSGYRSQLEKQLNSVIKMPIKQKSYGVFVKSPKGYEG